MRFAEPTAFAVPQFPDGQRATLEVIRLPEHWGGTGLHVIYAHPRGRVEAGWPMNHLGTP
jgi:hypothetical protein